MLAELECINKTCVLNIPHSPESLNLQGCSYSASQCLLAYVKVHHLIVDSLSSCSLSQLDIRHHEMLFVGPDQHVSQVSLEPLS